MKEEIPQDRPAPARSGAWLARLLVESALIVFSILLALAVDSWREARRDAERAERALASFEREIRVNLASLRQVAPYHQQLQEQFQELRAAGDVRSFQDLMSRLEAFQGFRPAFLKDSAWRTAVATGSLSQLDYRTAEAISTVYTLQEMVRSQSYPSFLLNPTALADENIHNTLWVISGYLGDLIPGERGLQSAYEQMLRLLESRPGRGRS